jgi:cysteine-rich repeat protein
MFTPSLPLLSKSFLRTVVAGLVVAMGLGVCVVPRAQAAIQTWALDDMANFSHSNSAYFEEQLMPVGFNLKPFVYAPSLNGANDVAISGNYAYATAFSDDGLEVLDISDPANPFHVDSLVDDASMLMDMPRHIEIIGDYAYVASSFDHGIQVFDISDPWHVVPTVSIEDTVATALAGAWDIEVVGNYAYVSGGSDDGVQILDVSIPSAPVLVSAFFNNSSVKLDGARGLTADNGKLYVTAAIDNALQIFDISSPTVLVPLGYVVDDSSTFLSGATSVEVVGNYAYVAGRSDSALSVIDVSVSSAPFEVTAIVGSPFNPFGFIGEVDVSPDGNTLYAGGNNGYLSVVDISTPGVPSVISNYETNAGFLGGMDVVGSIVYAAFSSGDRIEILDVSDPANLSRIGLLGDTSNWQYPTTAPVYGIHPDSVVAEIPWVMPNVGQPYTTFIGFTQAHWGSAIHSDNMYYQFSPDDGVTWYYYDNSTLAWVVATSNTLSTMTPSVAAQNYDTVFGTQFPSGTFRWRAFYSSDGTNALKLGWAALYHEYEFCGDGLIQTPNGAGFMEVCDDGNSVNNDACQNDCTLPGPPAASDACPNWGFVNGLSSYVIPGVPNSGRADFDRAGWTIDLSNIDSAPPGRGLAIDASDKVCFDSTGVIEPGNRWMWNNNFGWIDFEWCNEATLPGCSAYEPFVDFDNPTSYGAPWGGKVWNDGIGWIDFDWCFSSGLAGCEEYEVHTILPNPWPTSLTNAVGPVRGYGWNNLVGWVPFGDLTGAVIQELPTGGASSFVVQPVVTISPDPALATKYGGTSGVIAPLADAEDPYIIHVDFQVLDGAGVPTGSYLDSTLYDVEISETLVSGSNFGALKATEALTTGVDAVFWDSTFGDPFGDGFDWYISSFAPTSNINGQEDSNGVITKYFDLDVDKVPQPARDFYTIQDLDFTITPLSVLDPPAVLPTGWSLTGTWDLKFRPLIEVTNMAFSQVASNGQPFYNFFPTALDTNFYIRGIIMNWNASPNVLTNDIGYESSTTGISGGGWGALPSVDGYKVDYDLFTDLNPSSLTSALVFGVTGVNASQAFFNVDTNTPSNLIALGAKFSAPPASQYVPAGISSGRELNNPGAYFLAPTDVETVNLSSSRLGGAILNEALYSTTISYVIIDPLEITRSIHVAYNSNRLTSTPALSSTPSPIQAYLPVDPDPGEYLDSTSTGPGTIGSWGSVTPPSLNIGLMENALIVGSVTGSTANQTIVPNGDIVLLGDITTYRTRNALFQRFSKLKKGVTIGSNTIAPFLTSDLELLSSGDGAELLDGDLLYFKGDVRFPVNINPGYDQKTIVVEGGDVYLEGDLDGSNAIGLVVFKDFQGNGGDVYIHSNVQELSKLNIFADGSVMSTDTFGTPPVFSNITNRQLALKRQLYIGGSLISKNTIGGVRSDPQLLPTGAIAPYTFEAARYDLNHLREFQVCWYEVQADPLAPSQPAFPFTVLNAAGTPWTGPALPDVSYFVDCPGYLRSPQVPASINAPLYIEYIPPPPSLPLLGETQSSGFTVF